MPQEKWSKATGNAPNAELKSQKCRLSHLLTGQSIAENAGLKRDLQDSADKFANRKQPRQRGCFFV